MLTLVHTHAYVINTTGRFTLIRVDQFLIHEIIINLILIKNDAWNQLKEEDDLCFCSNNLLFIDVIFETNYDDYLQFV